MSVKMMAEQKDPTLFQIVLSVLASFFGVSNKENYDRDNAYLEKVGFKPYLIAAIILTVGLVLIVASIVTFVLNNVGS